jgi:hypothetical protein
MLRVASEIPMMTPNTSRMKLGDEVLSQKNVSKSDTRSGDTMPVSDEIDAISSGDRYCER